MQIIYDVFGKLILFKNDISSQEPINIEYLKSGIYFVLITDDFGNTSVKKLVKK